MHNFCTLFDSNYITRGLAMYKSLKKHCSNFHLFIFAFDNESLVILKNLALEKTTIISLQEFENAKLLAIKPTRSKAEYCWTCTSSSILYVLENYKVENCTYIDADLFFYSSPQVLFDEMGDKSVLITEHRYTKDTRSEIAGKYCVQFITFKNNENGMKILKWWSSACIEWCYDRYEDGKFGDQKYLDHWTTQFKGVHVLQHLGGGLAPWNIQQYEISEINNDCLFLKTKEKQIKFEAVFFHFHYVRFDRHHLVDLGWFPLSKQIVKHFYAPYINELENAISIIKKNNKEFKEALRPFSIQDASGIKNKLKVVVKQITRYNLFKNKILQSQIIS